MSVGLHLFRRPLAQDEIEGFKQWRAHEFAWKFLCRSQAALVDDGFSGLLDELVYTDPNLQVCDNLMPGQWLLGLVFIIQPRVSLLKPPNLRVIA